jgi:TonB-linked SusC/RagA family outer membrane protein
MLKAKLRFSVWTFLMILFFASGTFASGIVNGQSSKQEDAQIPIVKALRDVSKIYDTKFVYEKSLLEGKTTSFTMKDIKKGKKVEDILKSILYPKKLVFLYIKENYYTIVSRDRLEQQHSYLVTNKNVDISKDQMGNSSSKYPSPLQNQTSVLGNVVDHNVSGQVRNSEGKPMAGVSVVVENGNGATTDESGRYTLRDVPGNAILVFSYVGFITQRIPVEKQSVVDVVLSESNTGLNEVVVVGYGTQKKINLTGAVDFISGEELQNRPAPTVSQLIQGVSPNLNIAISNRGGEPGSYNSWNLRGLGSIAGSSSPLILIDGVESGIDDLDPETIESISVLKDASASAIYGSRAPFGVVLITTKRGQKNKVTKIQYNDNISWASPIRFPLMTDALTWAVATNQAYANSGLAPYYPDEQIKRIKDYAAGTFKDEYNVNNAPTSVWKGRAWGNANYDWPSILLRKNSLSQKHNISLTGGDDKTQYYVSAGFYDQGGLYTYGNDSYKRYNILANLNSKVTNWLSFDFGTKFSQTKTDYPLGIVGTARDYNFTSIFQFGPMTPMYNVDGTLQNPILVSMKDGGRDKTTNNDLWIRLGTTIEPLKGWKTTVTYNYDLGSSSNLQNPIPIPIELGTGQMSNIGFANSGSVEGMGNWNYYIFDALSSYEKTIGDHYFKAMVGYEQELSNSRNLNGSRMNLISAQVPSINAATGASTLGSSAAHWATEAVFGRINYNFKEKYLVEFSGRYNGSSRFAPDSRWGFFPSVSAGYNISKENFWNPVQSYINNLKIRASYGSLGNQNVANYLYLSTVPVSSNLNYIINNARPIYARVPGIISSTLTWETVTTTNVGLDAGFLTNRLGLTFDWYNRETTHMFGPSQDLPAILGTGAPYENNATLATKGFELSIDWKDQISTNLSYNAKLSLGNSKTTILKYNNNVNGQIDTWYEDKTYGDVWGLETDGLIQAEGEKMADQSYYYSKWGPGDMKYKDLDGNNIINEGSRTLTDHGDLKVIANTQPRYNIGFSGGVNWKGLSIDMFWQGVLKRDFAPSNYANAFYGFSAGGGTQTETYRNGTMLDYWRPADETNIFGPNTDAFFPKPYANSEYYKNTETQSRFVLNAAYVRLKNLQVGYTVPHNLAKKAYMQNARIYASVENLLTITKLPKTLDPETAFASDYNYGGLENLAFVYPLARRISFGINVTF